jgi:hypothetical protein
MKKFLLLLAIILLLPINTVLAQESNLTNETQYFDITLERGEQSAFGKGVTYTVYVTPKMDSKRTQILWDAPTAIRINERHQEFVDMYEGQTYSFKAVVKTTLEGSYEVSVNLIAWQYDTNYTNSVSDIITFDENLVKVPVDPGYTTGSIAKILIIIILCIASVFGILWLSKKGFREFKKWITPPN